MKTLKAPVEFAGIVLALTLGLCLWAIGILAIAVVWGLKF